MNFVRSKLARIWIQIRVISAGRIWIQVYSEDADLVLKVGSGSIFQSRIKIRIFLEYQIWIKSTRIRNPAV